jgi:diguanylate cyclase (GGDEF)-like protein
VFCANVAVGLDNVELVSHLHNAAFYDQLSKLPNRTRLVEILDATLAGPAREDATLSLVDLDHFAETNDALGHQFGDALLVAVAGRLQTDLGGQLTVARIGGDIFCVLGDSSQVNPAKILALFQRRSASTARTCSCPPRWAWCAWASTKAAAPMRSRMPTLR